MTVRTHRNMSGAQGFAPGSRKFVDLESYRACARPQPVEGSLKT